MSLRVAINGFGRIGRMILRAIAENKLQDIEVVAINDLGPLESNAHLFKYDTVHGRFPGVVHTADGTLDVGMGPIKVIAEPDPEKLPWEDLKVDLVLECTGRFTTGDEAKKHIKAGATKVLISAPAKDVDYTVVYGVNHDGLTADHKVVSNGSCTTNCLAPVAKVLHENIGIISGYMTTIHAYTGDQRTVDTLHSDLRRARAAAGSVIPTTTGAAKAVGLVLPELKGKLDGTALRVPTANVSIVDLKFHAAKPTSVDEINQLMIKASEGPMRGVVDIVDEPLVSIDFNHTPFSATFDVTQTQVIEDTFVRVMSWYDNEWGFANRMCDVARHIGGLR